MQKGLLLKKTYNDCKLLFFSGQEIDWDALYGPDAEEETEVDMKSQGSVITHLLSQVRIGMDLTKIVLPTFILERRSLLEMYR